MISTTEYGVLVGRLYQSLHLWFIEVIDHPLRRLLEWDSPNFGAPCQMLRRTGTNEVGQRSNRRQALVAGDDAAMALDFQMRQKCTNMIRGDIGLKFSPNG